MAYHQSTETILMPLRSIIGPKSPTMKALTSKFNKTDKDLRKALKLMHPEKLRFFFCFSDDVKNDIITLKQNLRERTNLRCELLLGHWADLGLFSTHNTKRKIQSVFDEVILKSDYVVFIFGDRFGKNTMHEWDICIHNDKRKPAILLGLQQIPSNIISAEEKRIRLGSGDIILDCPYSDIVEFEQKIVDVLKARNNKRMDEVEAILSKMSKTFTKLDWQLIVDECNKIERRAQKHKININERLLGIKQNALSKGCLCQSPKRFQTITKPHSPAVEHLRETMVQEQIQIKQRFKKSPQLHRTEHIRIDGKKKL